MLVASYCGVYITSFTGGVSGAIWLGPIFLLLIGPIVLMQHKKGEVLGSEGMLIKLTHFLFIIFLLGVIVGLLRFDPEVEFQKAGRFTTLFGIPIQYLMAAYRLHTVIFIFLAFTLPQRYYIDRPLFMQCLKLCWFFAIVLAIAGILDYLGIANLKFSPRWMGRIGGTAIMGFGKGNYGMIMITGILVSFAISQLTRSYLMKILGFVSIPLFVTALLFVRSRSTALGLVVGGLSLVVTLGGAKAFKGVLVTLVGAIVAYAVVMRFPELRERLRFFEIFYASAPGALTMTEVGLSRTSTWIDLIKWLAESPGVLVFGVGFQNFQYFILLHAKAVKLETAHNYYLTILAESGIVGLSVFIGWIVSILYWLISWRRTVIDKADKVVPGIFMSLMVALLTVSMTGGVMAPARGGTSWMVLFYLILGIWVSYYRTQMNEIYYETEYYDYGQYEPQQYEL